MRWAVGVFLGGGQCGAGTPRAGLLDYCGPETDGRAGWGAMRRKETASSSVAARPAPKRRLARRPSAWPRRGELHVRRPHAREAPRAPRPQPRGAPGRRYQPRVRVQADEPSLHRRSDAAENPADDLVPGEQRPGDLRCRPHPRMAPCAAARDGARSSRSCATSRCRFSIRPATAGSVGRRAGPHAALRSTGDHASHTSPAPEPECSKRTGARDRGPVRPYVRATSTPVDDAGQS